MGGHSVNEIDVVVELRRLAEFFLGEVTAAERAGDITSAGLRRAAEVLRARADELEGNPR
jgi:hypothetical protein